MNVSPKELAVIMATVQGSTMATVFACTVPGMRQKMSKTDSTPCPFYDPDSGDWTICKQATLRVPLVGLKSQLDGTAYERQVNAARMKSGAPLTPDGAVQQFYGGNMRWGRIVLTQDHRRVPLKYYDERQKHVRVAIQLADALDGPGRLYLDGSRQLLNVRYIDSEGNDVPAEAVNPWLIRDAGAEAASLIRTGKFVRWRNYALDNVLAVRIFSHQYDLTHPPADTTSRKRRTTRQPASELLPAMLKRINNRRNRDGLQPLGMKTETRRQLIDRLVGNRKGKRHGPAQKSLPFERSPT